MFQEQLEGKHKNVYEDTLRGSIKIGEKEDTPPNNTHQQPSSKEIKGNNIQLTDGQVVMTPNDFRFVSDRIQEETAKEIIADYMEALGTVVLPKETWLAIADINGKYLNKTLKENI